MKILLADYMYKHNLSERQVSSATGIPKTTIHRILSGDTIPRIDTLEKLAAGLNIRISDLYDSYYK